ncbi:MAG: sigma-54-dependent Fis family transcriptional regulator [Bdellovibrionales bacterium]|nr:sigma-54-dependent Fis family transcriptional regulator [Bdellovibrionales bacterium]
MKILVVDDDPVTLSLLKEFLEKNQFQVYLAQDADQAMEAVRGETIPLVLSDIRMEESDGLSLLGQLKRLYPKIVMILMTGFGSMEGAIEAIQKGAFDYISKPFDLNRLLLLVTKATKHIQSLDKDSAPAAVPSKLETPRSLIGRSPKIVEVYKTLARATLSSSTVLISGESGTGKELVARAIHSNSDRKTKKFVAVNCGALTETLLESELFGYVRGAFTGAQTDKKGLFEEANGGTLFLDEIGDITPGLQVKLLRALQEGEIKPVGSNQNVKVDVRIVAATHRDLDQHVEHGKFREDLYYRLKVIEIDIPPLRERKEDIPELSQVFLFKYSAKLGKKIMSISKEGLNALANYDWPGNVRELEHQIERAVALTSASMLSADDFDFERRNLPADAAGGASGSDPRSLEDLERDHILRVLKEVDYNKSKASEILGIDRATLYRKALKYGIALKNE